MTPSERKKMHADLDHAINTGEFMAISVNAHEGPVFGGFLDIQKFDIPRSGVVLIHTMSSNHDKQYNDYMSNVDDVGA